MKSQEGLIDVFLFGSSIRGKDKPNDIDLLILSKDKTDAEANYRLKVDLEKLGYKVQLTEKNYKNMFDRNFMAREALLSESYSFLNKRFFSEGLGYANLALFKYELKGFNDSKRMQFYYSLNGRNSKGLLKELRAYKFSDGVLLCPIENSDRMTEYLSFWKIKFRQFPILIPERIKDIL
jgi:predicted nucleotidyltransferase